MIYMAGPLFTTAERGFNRDLVDAGSAGEIDLKHYVFPELEEEARADFAVLPEMLDFCGEIFGPYPFPGQK